MKITLELHVLLNAILDVRLAIDVVMTFTDAFSPVTFKGSGNSSSLYVLMPMRI